MPEEWLCDQCGYVGTSDGVCPECGSKLVSVGDYDDDLAKAGNDKNKYSQDELEVDVMDDDIEFADEEETIEEEI